MTIFLQLTMDKQVNIRHPFWSSYIKKSQKSNVSTPQPTKQYFFPNNNVNAHPLSILYFFVCLQHTCRYYLLLVTNWLPSDKHLLVITMLTHPNLQHTTISNNNVSTPQPTKQYSFPIKFFHTPVCHYNVSTEITSKWGDWGVWGGYMKSTHFEVI